MKLLGETHGIAFTEVSHPERLLISMNDGNSSDFTVGLKYIFCCLSMQILFSAPTKLFGELFRQLFKSRRGLLEDDDVQQCTADLRCRARIHRQKHISDKDTHREWVFPLSISIQFY